MTRRSKAVALVCAAALLGTCARPPTLLEEIQLAGELRVVTRNGPTTYYIGGAGPAGPEYDLVKGFADALKVRLRLIVVDKPADVIPALLSGAAHLAAAGLTVNPDVAHGVEFGPAYQQVTEHLVYRDGHRRPRNLRQVAGRRIEVASGTSYVKTLARAQSLHPELVWIENPGATQSDLLTRVAEGDLDYTVLKSNVYALYRSYMPQIRVAFNLAEGESIAWAFPGRSDPSLRKAAERYFENIRTTGQLARTLDRYYGHMTRMDYVGTRQYTKDVRVRLPAYKRMFKQAAERHGLDWRLLAAIGYQESKWDPEAVSPTGVRGLMMLTEQTAARFGVTDRIDASQSIHGGARYFAHILARLPASIEEPDRTWFALAAYNMGYGHLLDARQLTRAQGGDWNKWQDVRPRIRLLADPEFSAQTRHGYARGGEALYFVNNVRNYYNVLAWMTREDQGDTLWTQQRSEPPAMQTVGDAEAPEFGAMAANRRG
jgi:membrane-bound lytic murein transglycosylase F